MTEKSEKWVTDFYAFQNAEYGMENTSRSYQNSYKKINENGFC